MKTRYLTTAILGILISLVFTFHSPLPAGARTCSTPPFIDPGGGTNIQNNLLFILDNSGSMDTFAYREHTGGRLTVTVSEWQSVEVPWDATCATKPSNCPTKNRRNRCERSYNQCTDSVRWYGLGVRGYCYWKFKCKWIDGACYRVEESGYPYCTKDDGYTDVDMTYDCNDSGMCTVNYTAHDEDSYTAVYGFQPDVKYYGLFKSDKLYKYDNTNHFFYTEDSWVGVGPNHLAACVQGESCPIGADKFSGNFLNWVTARRIDVAKKVMTGGRLGGDESYWVLVGTPAIGNSDANKLFNDNGSSGYYFTPYHSGMGILIDDQDETFRTPGVSGDPDQGKFVPLITFIQATFPQSASRGVTADNAVILSSPSASSNPGEPGGYGSGTGRSWNGSYYLAVKAGDVGVDDPPQGVVQKFADQMRMGYMKFNYGYGPADGTTFGSTGKRTDINGDGVRDHSEPKADGGRIVNRVGDDTTVPSRQREGGLPSGDRIEISSTVMNINETLTATYTPLAEVLQEAKNYFQQNEPQFAWSLDTDLDGDGDVVGKNFPRPGETYINEKGETKTAEQEWDPFYYNGALQPCTNSYIIFISDGAPNNDNPHKSGCNTLNSSSCSRSDVYVNEDMRFDGDGMLDDIAYSMHTQDMRTDVGDPSNPSDKINQTVELYTIYAFGNTSSTRDTLERAALQGGFVDKSFGGTEDGEAGYNVSTSDWRYVYPCDPGTTYHCRTDGYTGYLEWDSNADETVDHFFSADDDASFGAEVEKFITSVITSLVASGSAAAVATISQETSDGDVIVRGAFTAADPDDDSTAIWQGHLEAYWPTDETSVGSGDSVYEFDFPNNAKLFCGQLTDTHGGMHDHTAPSCWDGADILSARDASAIDLWEFFTTVEGQPTAFSEANVEDVSGNASPLRRLMRSYEDGLPSVHEAKLIVEWVRGDVDSNGQPVSRETGDRDFKNRKGSRLGDIVYSTPVIVGPPSLANVPRSDPNYDEFLEYRATMSEAPSETPTVNKRPKIAYVGANDGMIHAFLMAAWKKATDDAEGRWDYKCQSVPIEVDTLVRPGSRTTYNCGDHLWAYIPSNLVGELAYLCDSEYGETVGDGCVHRTMVDLSPKAYDVYIDPDGTTTNPRWGDGSLERTWRTVILGGERGGGDMYFAIDVTEPGNPRVLWEYSVLNNLPVVYEDSGVNKIALPYRKRYVAQDPDTDGDTDYYTDDVYLKLKTLPLTWSAAAVGRVKFPDSTEDGAFKFWLYSDPAENMPSYVFTEPAEPNLETKQFTGTDSENLRHIAFIGSGFRIFDTDILDSVIQPDNTTTRNALMKPYVMAIDVETGKNYFQLLWPLIVKARTSGEKLPEGRLPHLLDGADYKVWSTDRNTPWALATPTVIDVWDDAKNRFGEDAFVDHMYVGDLRGFMYKIRFDFKHTDGDTTPKGIDINFWKTKWIPLDDTVIPLSITTSDHNCDERNYYRGCRQPISVAPSVTVDGTTANTNDPAVRVIFGTGKFDDVIKTGTHYYHDDKEKDDSSGTNDSSPKMSLYNAKDFITEVEDFNTGGATFTVVRKEDSGESFDKITATGTSTDLASQFLITGTNMAIRYGDGFCGDVGTYAEPFRQYGCGSRVKEPGSECSTATKAKVCAEYEEGSEDRQACEDLCQEIVRTETCCSWLKACTSTASEEACPLKAVPDCCEGQGTAATAITDCNNSPCWSCVFDLYTQGERVIGRSVLFNGFVFFTTYIPSSGGTTTGCTSTAAGAGLGYLYVFDYLCRPFTTNPIPNLGTEGNVDYLTTGTPTGAGEPLFYGGRVGLGEGMPSQPVLDSKGESVIVQKSDASLTRIKADPWGKDNKDGDVTGWSER
jgi:Tfp pilus tip-associated adhesin PilY1